MTKIKILTISVICLAILNIVLVTSVLIGRPPRHKEPRYLIINMLDFDANQILKYESLIKKHSDLIAKEEVELKKSKQELYLTIKSNDTEKEAELLKEILDIQTNIELINLNHFKDIKSVCKPEQIVYYNSLIEELPHLFGRNNHKKRK